LIISKNKRRAMWKQMNIKVIDESRETDRLHLAVIRVSRV
jgi:hypothetical protein